MKSHQMEPGIPPPIKATSANRKKEYDKFKYWLNKYKRKGIKDIYFSLASEEDKDTQQLLEKYKDCGLEREEMRALFRLWLIEHDDWINLHRKSVRF